MEKGNPVHLDKKDKTLLYLLDVNARDTYSQLAKKTAMSKQLVKYRVERLEKKRLIKGYFTMIDTSKLGYTTFRTYFKFKNMTEEKKKELIAFFKKNNAIWAIVHISGKWDLGLGITVENIYEYYGVFESILTNYLPYIKDFNTTIYSPIFYYAKAYLVEKNDTSKVRILGGKQKVAYDEIDFKILYALSANARSSVIDLAKEVGVSSELFTYRRKQLEKKGIIQGYRAMIDVEKLGYLFFKTEIRLASYKHTDKIMGFCHAHPNIYQVNKTIGGETLEIEFNVKNIQEMFKILSEVEKLFPKTIESYDYITVLSEEKIVDLPVKKF